MVTENARVRAAVAALRERDLPAPGRALRRLARLAARRLRGLGPRDRLLVELASAEPDVYGARMTGGGFGGSIVAVVQQGTGRKVGDRVAARYSEAGKVKGTVLVPPPPETVID